ncbi:MAG: GGDEF domain-containing protein [Patescibacteria group bacterium]
MNPNLNPNLKFYPERRASSLEERIVYQTFQESIRAGSCKVQELHIAHKQELITSEQCISLLFLLAEELEKRASIDVLTKVLNRAFLEPDLEGLIRELNSDIEKRRLPIQSVMVIFLDIRRFKDLNDNHGGHKVGDRALVTVAERLKNGTKRQDMIFRVGGDEFVVLLPITDNNPQLLETIFERIRNSVNTNLSVEDHKGVSIPFSVSMGFEVLNKGDSATAVELLAKADGKMYEEKNRTKN